MILYHGTNKYGLEETVKQGYLLCKRGKGRSPCTYLAVNLEEAKQYGDIILEVEYDPSKNPEMNNYQEGCWQCRVYEPIYEYRRIFPNEWLD